MEKVALRKSIIAYLKNQDKAEKALKDQALLDDLLATKAYKDAKTIATYLAFDFEYNTELLIKQAQKDGKTILVPKTYPKGKMIFCVYNPQQLVKTKFGLWEPVDDVAVEKSDIDLIHVPGVGFNQDGFRIGYGAGYYDRYLTDYSGQTISTIYDCQKADFQPYSHDVAVMEVLSR